MRQPYRPSRIVYALALVAALMLVLHDVAMAGDPHVPASQSSAHHAAHDGLVHHAVSYTLSTATAGAAHPSGCGAITPAVAPRAAMTAGSDAGHALTRALDSGPHPLRTPSCALPGRSPTVLRALLQVYHI